MTAPVRPATDALEAHPGGVAAPAPCRLRALVLDDDPAARSTAANRLRRMGLGVAETAGLADACAALKAGPCDLALVDLGPGAAPDPGRLEALRDLAPGLQLIGTSRHPSVALAVAAMKRGASDFLGVPLDAGAFDASVARAAAAARALRAGAEFAADEEGLRTGLVGRSPEMTSIRSLVAQVAASDATTVLIEGETGVGKEAVAAAVHRGGARADLPFLQVNCAALPPALFESELFGHERGAFTDAGRRHTGVIEAARGGTVMLDEIGDLPLAGQAKLLRLLESRAYRRVGGLEELRASARIIASTNVGLRRRVAEGRFRADLFFRLNVVRIDVPPLRDRPQDVRLLARHFVARLNAETGGAVRGVEARAMRRLEGYGWPGNVRELRNALARAFILDASLERIGLEHLPPEIRGGRGLRSEGALAQSRELALPDMERELLAGALARARGNQTGAARLLGITRFQLRYRLRKHGLGAARPSAAPAPASLATG